MPETRFEGTGDWFDIAYRRADGTQAPTRSRAARRQRVKWSA
jgi:hypothetical protein